MCGELDQAKACSNKYNHVLTEMALAACCRNFSIAISAASRLSRTLPSCSSRDFGVAPVPGGDEIFDATPGLLKPSGQCGVSHGACDEGLSDPGSMAAVWGLATDAAARSAIEAPANPNASMLGEAEDSTVREPTCFAGCRLSLAL